MKAALRLVLPVVSCLSLTGCSGNQPAEKAIIGSWVQDVPVSMTDEGLQTTTSDTVLHFEKDGDIKRRLAMTLNGRNLPQKGLTLDVDLTGTWSIEANQLTQTPVSALVTPRSQTDQALAWAEIWQKEADTQDISIKNIVTVDKKQLILQDAASGSTDVYRRK